ncbi:MAG: hypothetical protein ACP5E5_06435 [Acidobacteriaceae bacterium]
MFFFFDHASTIDHDGAGERFITVPDAAMRSGNFTGMNPIYAPTTQLSDASEDLHRVSFAQEYGNSKNNPSSRIGSVVHAIQTYFPMPNVPVKIVDGNLTNNYFCNSPTTTPFSRYFGRLDFDVAPSNRLTASEAWDEHPAITVNQDLCPIDCNTAYLKNSNAEVSDLWPLISSTIHEAKMRFDDGMDFLVSNTLNQNFQNVYAMWEEATLPASQPCEQPYQQICAQELF